MTRSTKYIDVTDDSLSESLNPSETETIIVDDSEGNELNETLLPLWTPPMFESPEMKGIDNKKYFNGSVDLTWQQGYDVPKPTPDHHPKQNGSLRYENFRVSSRNSQSSSYQRMSQPNLLGTNNYDRPLSNKRVQSYLEMDKFDPHIVNNLTNEKKQKESKGKEVGEISFKFVSSGCLQEGV